MSGTAIGACGGTSVWLEVPVGGPGGKGQQEKSDRYLAKGQLGSVILLSQLPNAGSWILGRTPQGTIVLAM